MTVFDWLEGIPLPDGASPYDVVELDSKQPQDVCETTWLDVHQVGDVVVVDMQPGEDVGVVSLTGELVKSQLSLRKSKTTTSSNELLEKRPQRTYRCGTPPDNGKKTPSKNHAKSSSVLVFR